MTPQQYQTLSLSEADKLLSNFLFGTLTDDQQRQARALRAAIADPDLIVATKMLAAYDADQPAESDDDELLGMLRRKVWLLTDKFDKATAANKMVHDKWQQGVSSAPLVYLFTEDQMVQMELDMLNAQIELERES